MSTMTLAEAADRRAAAAVDVESVEAAELAEEAYAEAHARAVAAWQAFVQALEA